MTITVIAAVAAFETCRVSAVPFNREWPGHERELAQTREAKYARVEADGREQWLDVGDAAREATLLPMSAADRLVRKDGRWRLRVDGPADYAVDFGEAAPTVHVFAQPPWTYEPRPDDLYYGPGEHDVGLLTLSNSNCRVVIDRGAVVYGSIRVSGATNVTVCGRGTIDGSRFRRRNGGLLRFAKCRGVRVEGVVLKDSGGFNLTLDDCDDTVVDGVKIIGAWRYNSDGIDVCASRDTVVRNCFIRTYDDCVVARGACPWVSDAPLSRMMVSNNVLWCDWGKNCEVWAGSRAGVIEDVTYRDNRLVRTAGVAMDVTTWFGSSNTVIRNVLFENQEIDLENDRWALKLQAYDGEEFVRTRQPECVFGNVDCTGVGPEGGNEISGDNDTDYSKYRLRYSNVRFAGIRAYNAHEPLVLRVVADPRYHTIEGFSTESLPEGTVIRREGPASNNPVFQTDDVRLLAGRWKLTMDGKDMGVIGLPGTTDIARKGDGLVGGQAVERIHPQLLGAKMTRELTMHLTRRHPFVGVATYEKEVDFPASWTNRHVTLTLERTKIVRAFVDGICLGRRETLTTPAVFTLPAEIGPGRHVIRLEVDNRIDELPVSGHQVSDDTQTNWNGVMGRIELRAEGLRGIVRVDAYPNAATGRVRFRAIVRDGGSVVTNWSEKAYPPSAPRWSEFTPELITEEIAVGDLKAKVRFGLRDFAVKGTQFTVNGRPTFLRGRHDACVWPLTGAAPMDVDTWRNYFRTLRDYGLNHVRCHSWCPPEAAFAAADELGFYLQPEFPRFGGDFETDAKLRDYCLAESKRILDAYGNHPSFVMYTLSNEPMKGREERRRIVRELKAYDSRRLYAQGSNGDFFTPAYCPGDNFWSTFRSALGGEGNVRGSYSHADLPLGAVQLAGGGTLRDFSAAVRHAPVPLVGHEVGQYQAYPDYDEIAKYTGVLKPVNYEIFRSRLEKAGLLGQAKDFFRASGALMAINYREDVEEALRTPGFGGFQLLDLQDFPGQGTALVGILDSFMESKGFITPESWRGFCAPTVLLARFASHTLYEDEWFLAKVQVAHYGREDKLGGALDWRLVDESGAVAAKGTHSVSAQVGTVSDVCELDVELPRTGRARRLTLELALAGTDVRNSYPLWAYPRTGRAVADGVTVVRDLESAERLLDEGKRVLCILDAAKAPTNSVPGFFASDFWNWSMFSHVCETLSKPAAPGTLGLLVRESHPALNGFPTSFHSDWQWRELILNGVNVVLDGDPDADVIVQGIDNVSRNHRLGVIWEKRRGKGRLVVSAIDLERCAARPEAAALRRSLVDYLAADFAARPSPALFLDAVRLESPGRPLFGNDPLNSGWVAEGAAFRRQFNPLPAGLVRYAFGIAAPKGCAVRVDFLDADRRPLAPSVGIPAGTQGLRSGTFWQDGSLRFVRIVPEKSVSPAGLFVRPFRMTLDWAQDEPFSYVRPGTLPQGWTGCGATVEARPFRNACKIPGSQSSLGSKLATDNVLAVAPGGWVEPAVDASLLTDSFAFELSARIDGETDLAVGGVRLRDVYGFTPGIWYDFRFERRAGVERLRLNGRVIAESVARTGFRIENRSASARAVLDDFKAFALVEPADYPPAPVAPEGGEKYTVGMNVCSLWHNGDHYGWRCVDAAGGPKPVLGWYDEGLPEVADWEIKYMVEHGVDFQAFCWYPESNEDEIRHPRNVTHLRDGFKNARYSDRMKYCLIWEVMNAGAANDLETWKRNFVPHLIEHHFKDPRYLTWDGKAVLAVFWPSRFMEAQSFGSAARTREAFDYLSAEVRKIGLKGVYYVASLCSFDKPDLNLGPQGFDANVAYNYGGESGRVETNRRLNEARRANVGTHAIPTASVGFDVYPWDGVHNPLLTAREFEDVMRWCRDEFAPDDRLVWLSTWNEYGEGTYTMPVADERGFGYLDAVRSVFTDAARDPALNAVPTAAQRRRIERLYPAIDTQAPVRPDRDEWVVRARDCPDGTVALDCRNRADGRRTRRLPDAEAGKLFCGRHLPTGPVLESGVAATNGPCVFTASLSDAGVSIVARVTDGEHPATDLEKPWICDSLEFYFDVNPYENLSEPKRGLRQLFVLSDGRLRAENGAIDLGDVRAEVRQDRTGYDVSLFVPWKALGTGPVRELGFDTLVNDVKADRSPVLRRAWTGSQQPHVNRFTWGCVVR